MSLIPYKQWSPTASDSKGLACDVRQDWLVCPVMQTRDSGPLDRTNFAAFVAGVAEVDPNGTDHAVHRFGHWGPGWFEILLVRPGTFAANLAEVLARKLGDYPVLDEFALSEAEWEDACEGYSHRDAVRALRDALNLAQTTYDRLDDVPQAVLFDFLEPEIVSEDSGAHFDVMGAARIVSRKRMAYFLRKECR